VLLAEHQLERLSDKPERLQATLHRDLPPLQVHKASKHRSFRVSSSSSSSNSRVPASRVLSPATLASRECSKVNRALIPASREAFPDSKVSSPRFPASNHSRAAILASQGSKQASAVSNNALRALLSVSKLASQASKVSKVSKVASQVNSPDSMASNPLAASTQHKAQGLALVKALLEHRDCSLRL